MKVIINKKDMSDKVNTDINFKGINLFFGLVITTKYALKNMSVEIIKSDKNEN